MDQSEAMIGTLHPAMRPYARTLLEAARQVGVPLVIISALRSAERNRAVGGAPASLHLDQLETTGDFGALAFDVAVMGYTRDQVPAWWWQALGQWAEQNLGLYWGGRFNDPNHFDARRWLSA